MTKTYEKYKDSGSIWVDIIPTHWNIGNFRYFGEFTKGKLPSTTNVECKGLPIIGASEMLGKECRVFTEEMDIPLCDYGDILILWDGANAGIISSRHKGVVSSTVVKYHCNNLNVNKNYLFHYLKSIEPFFKEKVSGTTIPHMNMKYINEIPLLIPPLSEQQSIASFLDEKCGEIDSLIALQEEMITELHDYKQSVITEAVTKGLDPNAKMKDSGVEWIGKIPEGWKVIRLRYLCNIATGNKDTQDSEEDGIYKFYVRSPIVEHSNSWTFEGEGILMAGDGAGAGRVFHHAFGKYAVHQRVYRMAYFRDVNTNYLFYYLSSLFCRVMDMGSAQSTVPSVRLPMLTNFFVCIPPLSEQQQIATYLDEKTQQIDTLITLKQQKIEELKDYKKSIIYEYVTGKKKV